jgi:aquaporin TIP
MGSNLKGPSTAARDAGKRAGNRPDRRGRMKKWVARDDLTKSLAELIATFVFVFVGVGAAGAAQATGEGAGQTFYILVGLGHGIGIMLGVWAAGRISGGHMNPAVTIATVVTGNTGLVRGVTYIAAQLIGAVLAIAVLNGVAFDQNEPGLHQVTGITQGQGLLLEILLTFFLVWTIFAVAVDKRGSAALAPVAIGLVVTVGHFIGFGLTGASMNPARSFGPAAFFGNFNQHWVYWAGPIAGAVLAALIYAYFFGEKEARGRVWKIRLSGDTT